MYLILCIARFDKKELFRYPVTRDIASDYHDIIKSPMSFQDMIEKLSMHRYFTLDEFEHDLSLIWKNSMTYNKADTLYFKLAQRLEQSMKELMVTARTNYDSLNIEENHGLLDVEIDSEIFSYGDESKNLKISTTIEKENIPHQKHEARSSSSSLSSLSTISSDSTIQTFVKRRASDTLDKPQKKRRRSDSTLEDDQQPKKPVTRVTRSAAEKDKRSLRSRSIAKDIYQHSKIGKSSSKKRSASPVPISTSPMQAKRRVSISTEKATARISANESTEKATASTSAKESTKRATATNSAKEGGRVKVGRITRATSSTNEDKASTIQPEKPTLKAKTIIQAEAPVKTKIVSKPKRRVLSESKSEEKEPVIDKKKAAVPVKNEEPPATQVKFDNGEIVWARVRGFPSHPARVSLYKEIFILLSNY
jgi:hypothetical protein